MHQHHRYGVRTSAIAVLLSAFLTLLTACGGSTTPSTSTNATSTLAEKQVLTFPNVGTPDISVLDSASPMGPDANSALAINMIFSGLVMTDKDLNIVPDQATWNASADNKVYTFTLKPNITFSDGTTPVTAQTYVYTWTRALFPSQHSSIAPFFESSIVGASAVNSGKATQLAGVKALDDHTLQVTLAQPTPYFLSELANSLFFPLNQQIIEKYGSTNWTQHITDPGIGTGPFVVKEWDLHNKMIFVPNPHYYGNKTKLTEVDMPFVNDVPTAFKSYRAGQYSFTWNIAPPDQITAKDAPGFIRTPLLQTDLLFFDSTTPPFNNSAVRQAFAYAIDKATLVHAIFKDSVSVAPTIIPPGMPGYQPGYAGLPFDKAKAKELLTSVYPEVSKVPPIAFTFPSEQVSQEEASVLQQMWQKTLGIQVGLKPVDLTAYNDMTHRHNVQFGFTQWGADFPDPYDWLTLNLVTKADNNNGQWSNTDFDATVAQAEKASGAERIALYNKAEQIAVSDVGWLPIDHEAMAAIIPPQVHGITLNGNGLFFGDWSGVYLTNKA